MEKEEIDDIILKYLSGECTESERKELLRWSNSSKTNTEYFEKIKYTWVSSAQLRKDPNFETNLAFEDLKKALDGEALKETRYETLNLYSRKKIIQKILKYAAIFILVFTVSSLSSILVYQHLIQKQNKSVCYYEIPLGSKGKAVLPDGTQVWLNAGSKLSYATDYNTGSRTVKLIGEGFFEVVTNPKKPFIVQAKGLDIKAYGTAFNVKAYSDDKEVITTLVRGKVNIEGKDNLNMPFTIQMRPKQCVRYLVTNQFRNLANNTKETKTETHKILDIDSQKTKDLTIKIDTVKTELYTSWKDDRWVIENAKLLDLIKDLERRFGVNFTINSEELKKYHFSGTLQNENIEQVLNILRLTLPVKYTIQKNKIDLKLDSDLKVKYIQAM
jgi:transmembrane sensor